MITIIQPMIAPLYDGRSAHDVFQGLLDNPQASAYDAVSRQRENLRSKATPNAGLAQGPP